MFSDTVKEIPLNDAKNLRSDTVVKTAYLSVVNPQLSLKYLLRPSIPF